MQIIKEQTEHHLCCGRRKSWGAKRKRPQCFFIHSALTSANPWSSSLLQWSLMDCRLGQQENQVCTVRIGLNEISVKHLYSCDGCHWHIVHRLGSFVSQKAGTKEQNVRTEALYMPSHGIVVKLNHGLMSVDQHSWIVLQDWLVSKLRTNVYLWGVSNMYFHKVPP